MRHALKWIGTGLLFLLAALAFTGALLPPLLDRHYYRGPPSDHYDGERFFNPGERGKTKQSFLAARMARLLSGPERAEWPERVPVRPAKPPARIGPRDMVATWIGHATVLVQAGGVNILTDPIFSERASPFSWIGPKRARAPGIRLEDLPRIDLIVVSHNHYDHMDLPTLTALWERDRPVIVTSLGNDTILRGAGIPNRYAATDCGGCPGVEALDWNDTTLVLRGPVTAWQQMTMGEEKPERSIPPAYVIVERNHHWGSRWGADRNRALWSAFTINTPAGAVYFAGDTGFGDGSWAAEAARRGPIRLAILPIGAYAPRDVMRDKHVDPAEAVRVFDTLEPAMALGVHWGTFQLTFEEIDAPPKWLARVRGDRPFVTSEVGRPIVVPER